LSGPMGLPARAWLAARVTGLCKCGNARPRFCTDTGLIGALAPGDGSRGRLHGRPPCVEQTVSRTRRGVWGSPPVVRQSRPARAGQNRASPPCRVPSPWQPLHATPPAPPAHHSIPVSPHCPLPKPHPTSRPRSVNSPRPGVSSTTRSRKSHVFGGRRKQRSPAAVTWLAPAPPAPSPRCPGH
jgi:hypothetical protein